MSEQLNILVTGAGADRTTGIDFPVAADLLPAINGYLTQTDEGKQVDALLRKNIKGLRFRFDRFINSAISEITKRDPAQLKATIERVQRVVEALDDNEENELTRKQGKLVVRLFDQLQQIATANYIDDETQKLIEDVFGDNVNQFSLDDSVVDIRTLSVSETFKAILRHTLRQSLESEANEIAHALGADLLNIEQLLIEKFLGFYNNKLSDIKNYVYISWCLWAYLLHKDKKIRGSNSSLPFYSNIPSDWKGITLNYTSFMAAQIGSDNTIHFHGGLYSYVRMDNRQLLDFDEYRDKSPDKLLESHICGYWRFDDERPENSVCLIPSIVPPLRLKPVLSKNYIEIWHHAATWLADATHIILIGYSLNAADEHFNDLLRDLNGTKVTVIGPDVLSDEYKERVSAVWGVGTDQMTGTKIQKREALKWQNLTLIEACADEITLGEL